MLASIAKLERQLGARVRVIRSDGGDEFGSGKAKAYYLETGIQHYTTTRYTSELNGACERMIHTIKGMVSTMLADCKLPTAYWSYAARYAAVVIMKTSKGVPTAWEALTGRAEGVGTLRRFGERCIVQVPREIRKKADFTEMKGEPAVFLGQSEGISGWIVMMDKDGSITHSRDIRMTPHALSPTPPHREAEERSPPRLPIVELGPMEAKPPRINKRSIPSFSPSPEATELRLRPNTNLPQANRRSNFEPLPSAVWASPPMATTPSLPISKCSSGDDDHF